MRRSFALSTVLALVLGSISPGSTIARAQTAFRVICEPGQLVPPATGTSFATGLFTLDPATHKLKYRLSLSPDIPGTFIDPEVRVGYPGAGGGFVFKLDGEGDVWEGTSPALTAAQVDKLKTSQLHVLVRSTTKPSGAVRGQLTPAWESFDVKATGGGGAPNPTDSQGIASGEFDLGLVGAGNKLTSMVIVAGLKGGPVTKVEIAEGLPGTTEPTLITLNKTGQDDSTWANLAPPAFTPTQVAKLRAGMLYLVVKTQNYPNGEVRGQLTPTFVPFGNYCSSSTPGGFGLRGAGNPHPGKSIQLRINGAKANATGFLFVHPYAAQNKFVASCWLYVGLNPLPIIIPLPTDAQGKVTLDATIPLETPTLWVQLQFLGQNAGVQAKIYSSNGLGVNIH